MLAVIPLRFGVVFFFAATAKWLPLCGINKVSIPFYSVNVSQMLAPERKGH